MSADIFRACGCRDTAGKLLGVRCLKLADSKHGTWGYYISAGKDPLTGKRRELRKRGYPTKKAAQAARNEVATKLDKGVYVTPTKTSYAEYLTGWLTRHATTGRGLKPTTVDNYARYIDNDIKPSQLGGLQLSEIRRYHVNKFVDALRDESRGATTIRRIIAVVQGSLRSALEEGLIETNPATGVKLPTVEGEDFRPWEPTQVGIFLDVAVTHRLGPLFEVAVFTGLRRGELLGLRWEDVDLSNRCLHVRNNRTQARGRIVESTTKTRAGARTVDLDDRSTGALIAWKLRQADEATQWGEAWQHTSYVFTYENGEPLKPQYVTRLFEKLRTRTELPAMKFHGLRHENASLMIAAGTDIAIVSKRLGHSSISVTSDIYSHLIGSASRQAADDAAALVPTQNATTLR